MGVGEFILWLLAIVIFREITLKVLEMTKTSLEYKRSQNEIERFIQEGDLDEELL